MIIDKVIPEVATPTLECRNPERWSCYDGMATEVEVLKLLYSLVRAIKPQVIVETGTYLGAGTMWLAKAAKANGFGVVNSCDIGGHFIQEAQELLKREEVDGYAQLFVESGIQMIQRHSAIGFAFLDSGINIRVDEAMMVLSRLSSRGVIAVHDSNTYHANFSGGPRYGLVQLAERNNLQLLQLDTPRGLTLLKKK
jgi:predicted O-methyltransferase YrrM